jgi:hypothetical protein
MPHLHAPRVAHLHPAGTACLDATRAACLHAPRAAYLELRVDFGIEKNVLEGSGGNVEAEGEISLVVLPVSDRLPGPYSIWRTFCAPFKSESFGY